MTAFTVGSLNFVDRQTNKSKNQVLKQHFLVRKNYLAGYCRRNYFSRIGPVVSLPHSRDKFTLYSNRLNYFSVTIPRCYKDVYFQSVPFCSARLWNLLPVKWFPLASALNGFKSRVNRHLLPLGFF